MGTPVSCMINRRPSAKAMQLQIAYAKPLLTPTCQFPFIELQERQKSITKQAKINLSGVFFFFHFMDWRELKSFRASVSPFWRIITGRRSIGEFRILRWSQSAHVVQIISQRGNKADQSMWMRLWSPVLWYLSPLFQPGWWKVHKMNVLSRDVLFGGRGGSISSRRGTQKTLLIIVRWAWPQACVQPSKKSKRGSFDRFSASVIH